MSKSNGDVNARREAIRAALRENPGLSDRQLGNVWVAIM
jgi:hypothetical protein